MKKKILVVGGAGMTLLLLTQQVPEAGEWVTESGSYGYLAGGRGGTAAVAFTRLGADAVLSARLGGDTNGYRLLKLFEEAGIDRRFLHMDNTQNSGLSVVMREANGATRTICYPGANEGHSPRAVEEAFACEPDALYVEFGVPFETVSAAMQIASERGIPIIANAASSIYTCDYTKLPPMEIFTLNAKEAERLTGTRPAGTASCLTAAHEISKLVRARYYVLKIGDRGSYVYDGKFCHLAPAYTVRVKDTTGAGDIFAAALTFSYLENGDIRTACAYGNAAAAIAIAKVGAAVAAPSDAEIREFLLTHKA